METTNVVHRTIILTHLTREDVSVFFNTYIIANKIIINISELLLIYYFE